VSGFSETVKYHYVITVQAPAPHGGTLRHTIADTIDWDDDREGLFWHAFNRACDEIRCIRREASVLCWSLGRNDLT
jgi:hypothetical protein